MAPFKSRRKGSKSGAQLVGPNNGTRLIYSVHIVLSCFFKPVCKAHSAHEKWGSGAKHQALRLLMQSRPTFRASQVQPLRVVQHCHCPALFASAEDDRVVSPQQVEELHSAWVGHLTSKIFQLSGRLSSAKGCGVLLCFVHVVFFLVFWCYMV